MSNFAYFRLPDENVYYKLICNVIRLGDLSELKGVEGFVMMPFKTTPDCPLVLFQPTMVFKSEVPAEPAPYVMQWHEASYRSGYRHAFSQLHYLLSTGALEKVVLAKRADCRVIFRKGDGVQLFLKACRLYPHQMIVYASSQLTNTWLMATPEVLLERTADSWHTMALAGTMREEGEWSQKNQREQSLVTDFISSVIEPFADDVRVDGPYTMKAGMLCHLRTDFNFQLKPDCRPEQLVKVLHPTPAVCGLPRDKAMAAIDAFENTPRYYYSGFCGPWNFRGMTNLFVTLRCMGKRNDRNFSMFAGGGLISESRDMDEWEETETKLEVMRNILR